MGLFEAAMKEELCKSEFGSMLEAFQRLGEKIEIYYGRFAPHNIELSLRTVPGGAMDFVFDKDGKLLSISRRYCVNED